MFHVKPDFCILLYKKNGVKYFFLTPVQYPEILLSHYIFPASLSYYKLKNMQDEIMKIKDRSELIIAILIPIAVGTLSALFAGNMNVYSVINKPSLSPPGILFPIVWTILYILMGISSYIIYESDAPGRSAALQTYVLQLFFNFFWSILFFRFDLYFTSFVWLLALLFLIVKMIWQFNRIDHTAARLLIPYLLWCLFAAYLNFMIFRLN